MSSPFWTLLSGPVAVALYENFSKTSNLAKTKTVSDLSDLSSINLINTAILPVAIGYAGSYVVARFTGATPLYAAAGGALTTWLYYDKMTSADYLKLAGDEVTLAIDFDNTTKNF